jgi:hypothetical protein
MTTFFYFQSLLELTDIIDIGLNQFHILLRISNDKKYPEHAIWYNAQYAWYGLERI